MLTSWGVRGVLMWDRLTRMWEWWGTCLYNRFRRIRRRERNMSMRNQNLIMPREIERMFGFDWCKRKWNRSMLVQETSRRNIKIWRKKFKDWKESGWILIRTIASVQRSWSKQNFRQRWTEGKAKNKNWHWSNFQCLGNMSQTEKFYKWQQNEFLLQQ